MKSQALVGGLCAAAIVILGLGIPVRAQEEDHAPPDWIADAKTGCKVWNPAPEGDETVRWSGPCKNGYADGMGTLLWTENGQPAEKFVGAYQGGKRNGHGVLTDTKGNRVEGDWRDDIPVTMGVNEI